MNIGFFLSRLTIGIALLTPSTVLAGDCWVASLKIKVHEKSLYRWQHTTVETGTSSLNLDAEGQVSFSVEEGELYIISKRVAGNRFWTFSRDTPCAHHEGATKGILTEGIMGNTGRHVAYWKLETNAKSTTTSVKGCMQDPTPPLASSEEEEEIRFEGIVHPAMHKVAGLCTAVKDNPKLGYCNETTQGFSGQMIQTTPVLPGGSGEVGGVAGEGYGQVEASEIYEWDVKKVPCECSAIITDYRGDVKINGSPLSGEGRINLSGTVVETGRRSSATIEIGNTATLELPPNSSIDLTQVCERQMEAGTLTVKKFLVKLNYTLNPLWILYRTGLFDAPPRLEMRVETVATGVRGAVERDRVLLASSPIPFLGLPILAEGSENKEINPFVNERIKKGDAVLYVVYSPEERYLIIESVRGSIMLRDSSGNQRVLNEGERLHKKWTASAPASEMKVLYALIGP